ncbi:MAG: hypothetical protein ACOYD4_07650, partial [Solirubrobacterales bacterium]
DAAAACLALDAAGYRGAARRIARNLGRLDLAAAARFGEDGYPIAGRGPQGDAGGWAAACAEATGSPSEHGSTSPTGATRRPSIPAPWRNRPDYQESAPGDFLGNAIASTAAAGPKARLYRGESARRRKGDAIAAEFGTPRGLVRRADDPGAGLDSAAAWAVRPFPLPSLYPQVRRTLLRLAAAQTRFGITPGEGWSGGVDPWTAPTAWSAWAFAALADSEADAATSTIRAASERTAIADRRRALRLLGDLRRAATPAGSLPERVDARTGVPRSTTPLAWSHAFAILALRQLWPAR